MTDLSVIVVTHNRAELALTTLRSARAAIHELDVSSGSSSTAAPATAHPRRSSPPTPTCACCASTTSALRRPTTAGWRSRAAATCCCSTPTWRPSTGTYDELVATLDARPEIGVASVVQNAPDGGPAALDPALSLALARAWRGAGGGALDAAAPLARGGAPHTRAIAPRSAADWLVGAFLIARAEALAEVGGLDERFFLYSEETDWCYRFHRPAGRSRTCR